MEGALVGTFVGESGAIPSDGKKKFNIDQQIKDLSLARYIYSGNEILGI